jgi:hypothetical protein
MAHGEAESLTGAGSHLLYGALGGDAECMLEVARDGLASLANREWAALRADGRSKIAGKET